jgi:hypothetical protein
LGIPWKWCRCGELAKVTSFEVDHLSAPSLDFSWEWRFLPIFLMRIYKVSPSNVPFFKTELFVIQGRLSLSKHESFAKIDYPKNIQLENEITDFRVLNSKYQNTRLFKVKLYKNAQFNTKIYRTWCNYSPPCAKFLFLKFQFPRPFRIGKTLNLKPKSIFWQGWTIIMSNFEVFVLILKGVRGICGTSEIPWSGWTIIISSPVYFLYKKNTS